MAAATQIKLNLILARLDIIETRLAEAPLIDEIDNKYEIHDKLNFIFGFISDIKKQQDQIMAILQDKLDGKYRSRSRSPSPPPPTNIDNLFDELSNSFDEIMEHRNAKAKEMEELAKEDNK